MRIRIFGALVALALCAAGCRADGAEGLPVQGKLALPEGVPLAQAEVVLQLDSGRRLLAFPTPDGAFSFAEVPLGVHTLSIDFRGLLFPTVKLDVGAALKGKVAAAAADVPGAPSIPYPLLLRPFSRVEFFEKRQGFSLWGFIKTPYGMMAGFMIFSMFIMPKLKIDPEEYKEMVGGDRAASPAPSLTASGQQQGRRRSD